MDSRDMSGTILIVDDDRGLRYSLKKFLKEKGLKPIAARNGQEALELLDQGFFPDVALVDIILPKLSGLDLLKEIRQKRPDLPIIVATAYGSTEKAIQAMKLGAYDYIQKPFDMPRMCGIIQKAIESAQHSRTPTSYRLDQDIDQNRLGLIGSSLKMQEIYKTIGQIAGQDVHVLITGESGTGKELVARALYHYSQRKTRPFLPVNCAAIPVSLLESTLFGHERGAFTGAEFRHIGRFEQAHRGTIFLDEIGDMPAHIQAKILRAIQQGEIQRLGSSEAIPVDIRLISATNKDIERGINEGWFREDLYYRLHVMPIHLPPLRERKEDIPQLIQYFLSRFTKELDKEIIGFRSECLKLMMKYHWPGNVRELENVIKRAMIMSKGKEISVEDLPGRIRCGEASGIPCHQEAAFNLEGLLDQLFEKLTIALKETHGLDAISILEKEMIARSMRRTSGNKAQAAALLGMNRNTIRNKVERYRIRTES